MYEFAVRAVFTIISPVDELIPMLSVSSAYSVILSDFKALYVNKGVVRPQLFVAEKGVIGIVLAIPG